MKFFLIIIFTLVCFSVNAQTITVSDGNLCFDDNVLTFNVSDGGSPARNIYTGFDPNGFPVRVIWLTGNWRLQFDESGWTDIYVSSFASAPNPPDDATGGWDEVFGGCGATLQFSGTGTQSTLPVTLIYFKSILLKNEVLLDWVTATEINNEKFEIERSFEGQEFKKIGEVKGKGTTSEQQDYSFEVKNPRNGISYYRLKQIDFDGQFEYSKVISVNFKGENGDVGEFYPNPSNSGLVNLNYFTQSDEEITVSVFDMTGKLLVNQIQQASIGDNNLSFDFSDLNTGIYIVKIGDERNPIHRKLIIER